MNLPDAVFKGPPFQNLFVNEDHVLDSTKYAILLKESYNNNFNYYYTETL